MSVPVPTLTQELGSESQLLRAQLPQVRMEDGHRAGTKLTGDRIQQHEIMPAMVVSSCDVSSGKHQGPDTATSRCTSADECGHRSAIRP